MRAANQFADAATGVVYVHASPAAVCPHVEWALSSTLQARANLKWTPQPAMPGQLRAVTNWVGPVGTGAQLANALRSWSVLRFEVTEDPSAGVDGHRWCHTPQLGLWSGAMSANGDVMVGEMRLRTLMASGADMLAAELDSVLGTAWDEALEPYRDGGDTAEVSWLNRGVGLGRLSPQDLQRPGHRRHFDRQRARVLAVGVGVDAGGVHGDRLRARSVSHLVEIDVRALEHGGEQANQPGARRRRAPS